MKFKKIIILLLCALLIFMCACQEQERPDDTWQATGKTVKEIITPNDPPSDTETVSCLRKEWDEIDNNTKQILKQCGISKENLIVDKSKLLTQTQPPSAHAYYACYSDGNIEYYFNDLYGKLTFVAFPVGNSAQKEPATEQEIIRKGEAIADILIDKTKNYPYSYYYDEAVQTHSMSYRRKVGNFLTAEGITLMFTLDGSIQNISITKIGLFDNIEAPHINEQQINQKCEEILKQKYSDYESHTVNSYRLDIKDGQAANLIEKYPEIEYGQFVMNCSCSCILTNGDNRLVSFSFPVS